MQTDTHSALIITWGEIPDADRPVMVARTLGGWTVNPMNAEELTQPLRIPVIVVQRHRVLRDAVHRWLESEPTVDVIAAEATVSRAASVLLRVPDAVVVVDEPGPGDSASGMMSELRAASATARAVMLVGSPDVVTVSAAINAGVAGVLCSDAPSASLVQAVRTVACGACVIDEVALRQLAGSWQHAAGPMLSAREREVLALLAAGSSNLQIAAQLYVSAETVKTHVAHVLRKLDVPNRGSAVEKATRLGLLN
jgi:two-component system nitrate/nitrite response regulator NarL